MKYSGPNLVLLLSQCLVLAGILSACSFGPSKISKSLEIEPKASEVLAGELVGENPYIYQISIGSDKAFLAAFRECGLKSNVKVLATTRELFIGLKDLHITEVSELPGSQAPLTLARAQASFEDTSLSLISISRREAECVYDITLWTNFTEVNFDLIIQDIQNNFDLLIKRGMK